MDDRNISLLKESGLPNCNPAEQHRNYIDDSDKYRLELLKDTKINKANTSSAIYVKPCGIYDPSQPCGTKYDFYKRHISTPFLCSEKIKNPVIVKEEDRIEEN